MSRVAVVTKTKRQVVWVDYLGEAVPCRLGSSLRVRSRPVPGDEVLIERRADGSYTAVSTLPRRSRPVRLGNGHGDGKPVANVDQIVYILDAGRRLAESEPVGVAQREARVLVAVNKCDLSDEAEFRSRVAPWVERGVDVVLTSALTGRGLGDLRSRLEGHVSAMVGASGAGKTSLLEALYPGYRLREKKVELYPLPGGGYLAV